MGYSVNYDVIWRNLHNLFYGLGLDLYMALVSVALGSLIGLVVAFSLVSKRKLFRVLSGIYVAVIRNIPLMIIILFIYFGLPEVGLTFAEQPSFIFALTIYAGAYIAEVFRGGLLAIPKGVGEAGMAVGMSNLQINVFIKIPILVRSVMPALSNNYISLFKDASIAAIVAVPELTFQTRKINTDTFRTIEAWSSASVLYVATCFIIAFFLRRVERRVAIPK
ncbi:MAG: amino acid ABC transporter permease [Actinomycetes bacterium]